VEAKVDLEVIEMTMTNLRVDLVVEIRVDLEVEEVDLEGFLQNHHHHH
jgi:hypothetical protein